MQMGAQYITTEKILRLKKYIQFSVKTIRQKKSAAKSKAGRKSTYVQSGE